MIHVCLFHIRILSLYLVAVSAQNYYYIVAKERDTITIECNAETVSYSTYSGFVAPSVPYLVVDEVTYTFDNCSHTDPYGVKNECDNKTSCLFQVTNTLVGSSCGGSEGDAGIAIKYHCVREGAWTSWSGYSTCTRTCGGGYQYRTRTCTNPPRNYFGSDETCRSDNPYIYNRCNTQQCPTRTGSDCRDTSFTEQCNVYDTKGYMSMGYAEYKEGCSYTSDTEEAHYTVTSFMQGRCNGHYSCTFPVDDDPVIGGANCNYYFYHQHVSYYCCDPCWDDGSWTCCRYCTTYSSHHHYYACGILNWNYDCTIPEWTLWGSWSGCSQTCNRGIQTRTRSCENGRTTVDGVNAQCCQTGSQCHTTETRECPMPGTQPYCTYCSGAPERYKEITTTVITDTDAGNAVILESDIHIVRCCGLIKKWQFVPKSAGTLTLIVWRPTGTAGEEHIRIIVGTNTVTVAAGDVGTIQTFTPAADKRIAIRAGDLIGWHGTSSDIIGREPCSEVMNVGTNTNSSWDYRPNYCPMKTYKKTINDLSEGTRVDWSNTIRPNWFYAIQYEATTNTAPVFDMPVVSVSHPDHLPIDTSLIQFYFTNADYGDSYVKYSPDYDHPYLYFDYNELAVYSKTALPHTVGTHEQETTFVVWAEDGCYNRVTGTVTVTTYNVEPQFYDLPETVIIDDSRTGEMYFINVTDHQNDPITCTITGTIPSTDAGFFYISDHKVMLGGAFSLNKDVASEYTLDLSCSDGTDANTTFVIFEIRRNLTEWGIPETYYYYNTTEGLNASLSCVQESEPYDDSDAGYIPPLDPYIKIDAVHYVFYNHECNHSNTYGVKDYCEDQPSCSFNVTNSNVQSSCGTDIEGIAGLYIVYHCVKDGGWTAWSEWSECTRTCGGGMRRSTRNFTNPSSNYHSKQEVYHDTIHYKDERCNTQPCPYSGDTCRLKDFSPICSSHKTNGYLTITYANYTHGCGWEYNTENKWHDVTSVMQGYCDGHYDCTTNIQDSNLVSCSEDYARNTAFIYTDISVRPGTGWYYDETTKTSSVNNQYWSYCGKMYWDYLCTIPQWALWGEWSACSVTCGRGTQTRTRSCDNEYDTLDGHAQRCNQPGSELHREEIRECPLKGTHDFCLYCPGAPERYKDITTSVVTDTDAGNAVILESDIHIVRCCGLINKWEFVPTSAGTLTLIVWRPTGTAGEEHVRTIVGTNTVTVAADDVGTIQTFTPATDKRIAIRGGDLIGWHVTSSDMIGRESCSEVMKVGTDTDTSWDYRPNYCPMKTYKTTINDLTEGTRVDWSNTLLPRWFYAIQYETTTNTDPVFDMPVVTASHPDHLPIDTSLIQFYFTDTDYGDSYVKYSPDYDNPYFYFDSNELAVYSKAALPHTIGIHEQDTIFVIWAEDGCYNRVTGTVTIQTYNVAPQFHELPESVNIHENRTGEMYSINVTDFRNDPIICTVTNTTPSTDVGFFYIDQGTKVMLGGSFTLSKTMVSQYTLNLTCSDGTDDNTTYVIFEITDDQSDVTVPILNFNSRANTLDSSAIIGVVGTVVAALALFLIMSFLKF